MQRITSLLILLAFLLILPVPPASAGFFNDTLVSINGTDFSTDDFRHWWQFWKEEDMPFPATPDPYIEWLLLNQEGKQMELDSDPGFKRQTRIFLQSRTLMMLKYETVDSQLKVTDAEVKAHYEEKYLPRWKVLKLKFGDQEAALAAWQEMTSGTLTLDDLLARDTSQGGPALREGVALRANGIDPGWAAIFQEATVGNLVDPNKYGKGRFLYFLTAQLGSDEEDLASLSEGIRKDLWREKQNIRTRVMIDELRDKYQVKVDEERLAALDIMATDDSLTDAPIISTSQQNFSEKDFIAVIRRLMASRPTAGHAAADKELAGKLKAETVDTIIAQYLTNWESLARHYEEKEPFKWEYDFNYNHRLVMSLEQRLFAQQEEVTDAEIKQNYDANLNRYTQPSLAKLYIIDETQRPIDQIWAEVAVGKRFEQVLKESSGQPVVVQDVPVNHLDPEVKAVVDKMRVGETSQIFEAQKIRVMVHLVERTPEAPLPLARVEQSIRKQIWKDKLMQSRNTYLEKLKSQSQIEVRQREWKALQKELGGA
jgi:hypothetical protein